MADRDLGEGVARAFGSHQEFGAEGRAPRLHSGSNVHEQRAREELEGAIDVAGGVA